MFHEPIGTQPLGSCERACSSSASVTPGSGSSLAGAMTVSTATVSGSSRSVPSAVISSYSPGTSVSAVTVSPSSGSRSMHVPSGASGGAA